MADKNDNCDDAIRIDQNAILGEMGSFTGATRHIKAAGYGLAAPLSTLRLGQMRAEKARAVGRHGANSAVAKTRDAQLTAATVRAEAFDAEFSRTLVDPPAPDPDRAQAGFHGRIVEDGDPRPGLIVGAVDDKDEWQGHTCTGERGEFAFSSTADVPLRLIVTEKSGATLYRDTVERTYVAGQVVWREIDLAIADDPCDSRDGGNGEDPEPQPVTVPPVIGLLEADAVATLRKAGLARGERTTRPDEDNVDKVVEQNPEAGTQVERGSAVAIVVGISTQIRMPEVVGMPIDIAREKLSGIPHGSIEIEEKPDPDKIGIVLAQAPKKDSVVTEETEIVLTVGVADRLVMPSLIGDKPAQAKITLAELGISNIETAESVDPQRIGLVVDQKPRSGETVTPDTKVTLVIGVAEDRPGEDTRERFRAVIDHMAADDRFTQLQMSREKLEQAFKDRGVDKTSALRGMSESRPQDVRARMELPTLKAATLLRTLLRAAFKALDQG